MPLEFHIFEGCDTDDLSELVTKALADEWVIIGDVVFDNEGWPYLAMTRQTR